MLDDSEDLPPDMSNPRPPGHGRLIAVGVVGAIALGAGLGLWARPAPPPQAGDRSMAPEDAPRPALQIVVDDRPAALGPLLEVLPGEGPAREAAPIRPAPPLETLAPRRPAAGLMKVDAVVAAEPLPVQKLTIQTPPPAKIEPPPARPRVEKAEPKAKPEPRPEAARVAEARARKIEAARKAEAETARAAAATKLAKAEKAKADKAKAEKLAKAEKAQKIEKAEKAEKAKAVKLAQAADAKREKAAKAKAEARRLAALAVKAAKAAPKTLNAEAAKAKVQLAKAKPVKPKVEKASTKPMVAKAPAPKKVAPVPRKPAPVGEGPMRVARNDACASADPGEAVVCADRRLGARDRQLQQAYRNAEAAGVPAVALRRQQARWLQARAAAAREAPWAVEDVYEARISELNDLTRDAREN